MVKKNKKLDFEDGRKKVKEIGSSIRNIKKDYINDNKFIWGLFLGLFFGIVGNLLILILDKLFLNNLSEDVLYIILIVICMFIFILFILIYWRVSKNNKEVKNIEKIENILLPALENAIDTKEKERK